MLKRLITGIIVAGAVSAVTEAISKSKKKPETNEHDAEKEIFRSLPMNESDVHIDLEANATPTMINLKCQNCNGELQLQRGNRIVCCPYCQSQNLVVLSDNVEIALSEYETYQEVELAKIQAYERIAIEREKAKIEKQKQESKEKDINLIISGIIVILILIWMYFIVS